MSLSPSLLVLLLLHALVTVVDSSFLFPSRQNAVIHQETTQKDQTSFICALNSLKSKHHGRRRRRRMKGWKNKSPNPTGAVNGKQQVPQANQPLEVDSITSSSSSEESLLVNNSAVAAPPNRDAMVAQAAVLRQSILKQQMELQQLERRIICCSTAGNVNKNSASSLSSNSIMTTSSSSSAAAAAASNGQQILGAESPVDLVVRTTIQTQKTFISSLNVLLRKLNRVKDKIGPNNKKYKSVEDYVVSQTKTGLRILDGLAKNPTKIRQLAVDPATPTLVPHLPSIYARLDRLETHVDPILEKVLNNRQHFASIEPYFDEVMERFDDIEPHLPWILKHIDTLAPYTGLLLRHIDELLLYADGEEGAPEEERYDLAEQVLPYLEFYVSRLDIVGPHLPLLRPHLPLLLKHNRIAKVTPHIDRLFARGYLNLGTSANLDVLLFWVGWTLRVPLLPRLFFAVPWSPRFVTFLANRLPKRFVRGYCNDVSCIIDADYGPTWNRLSKD